MVIKYKSDCFYEKRRNECFFKFSIFVFGNCPLYSNSYAMKQNGDYLSIIHTFQRIYHLVVLESLSYLGKVSFHDNNPVYKRLSYSASQVQCFILGLV